MEKRFSYARLLLPTSCIIMRLIDVLTQDCIIADLKGSDKREVLEEMVEELSFKFGGIDKEKLLEVLLEREKLGSTGIGYGVAIPHARLKGLDGIVVYFGVLLLMKGLSEKELKIVKSLFKKNDLTKVENVE